MAIQDEPGIPPQFSPLSIARAVWKRKLWVLFVWAIVSAVTFVVVMRLPAVYRAQSLILIEGQRIPERYVPATVNDELSNRLSMLTQQIKSYTALLDTIERFGLYNEESQSMVEEEIIAKMREDIQVELVRGWGRQSFPAFTISYEAENPNLVARVAEALTTKFRDQNLKMRGEQARGTSQFLESQLNEARLQLEKQEALLSEFRQQYQGELPSQSTALLAKLSRLEVQLKGIQDSVRSNDQQKILIQNSMQSAEGSLKAFREFASLPAGSRIGSPGVGSPQRQRSDVLQAEAQLASYRMRYSDDHPDVVRATAQLQRVREDAERQQLAMAAAQQAAAQLDEAAAASQQTAAGVSPVDTDISLSNSIRDQEDRIGNLQVQLKILDDNRVALENERSRVLAEMNATQRRVEALPLVEQQLAQVVRDYDMSRSNYQQLLNQKMEADTAAKMETLEKAERLVVLDMPRVPSKPIRPNRERLIAMGCLGGLALGMLLGFGIEFRSGVFLGEWELPEGSTVLGRVPPMKLAVATTAARLVPTKRRGWSKARLKVRLRAPNRKVVLAPTILLFLLGGALVVTSIYTDWSPF